MDRLTAVSLRHSTDLHAAADATQLQESHQNALCSVTRSSAPEHWPGRKSISHYC